MSQAIFVVGDVRERLAELPDGSVDLILTSPPFLALRSYLPPDHPDKRAEIGAEPTPAAFLDTLLELTAEWRRILAPHGSLVVELGDTYAGSGGAGGDYAADGLRDGQPRFDGSARAARSAEESRLGVDARNRGNTSRGTSAGGDWPLEKSLCGVPTLYAWSLAYGRNLLTGASSPAGRWRVRNLVAWCRPNPPVGSLSDKFRPATSYLVVACLSRDRWFDLEAVRQPPSPNTRPTIAKGVDRRPTTGKSAAQERGGRWSTLDTLHETSGSPPLDWWEIPTRPYRGAHDAAWPPDLLVRPIEAMCPRRVCTTCGEPSRRIVEAQRMFDGQPITSGRMPGIGHRRFWTERTTVGWSDCGHGTWRPGVVLDPFTGSGTTLAVAVGLGRAAVGIDLDERNVELARERVGMWLEVVDRDDTVDLWWAEVTKCGATWEAG